MNNNIELNIHSKKKKHYYKSEMSNYQFYCIQLATKIVFYTIFNIFQLYNCKSYQFKFINIQKSASKKELVYLFIL